MDLQVAGTANPKKRTLVRVWRTRNSLQISDLCLVQVEFAQVARTEINICRLVQVNSAGTV
jgi:ABC-type transporter Mla MlaB component